MIWKCPKCGQGKIAPRYNKCPNPTCNYLIDETFIKKKEDLTWEDHRDGNIGIIKDSPEYSEVKEE